MPIKNEPGNLLRIKKILLQEWDPIGIKDVKECEDEYDSYAEEVFRMINSQASQKEVFDYLAYIETDYMGLKKVRRTTKELVKSLFNRKK